MLALPQTELGSGTHETQEKEVTGSELQMPGGSLQAWGTLTRRGSRHTRVPLDSKTRLTSFCAQPLVPKVFGFELTFDKLPAWFPVCWGPDVGTFPHPRVPFHTR